MKISSLLTFYSFVVSSTFIYACENLLNLDECINVDAYNELWNQRNNDKCGTQDGMMHCQKQPNGRLCSVCASPKTCEAGEKARLDTVAKTVSCVQCEQGWFQEKPQESYKFLHYNCDAEHTKCGIRKTLCFNGTATRDNKCRCDHKAGYKPSEGCDCFDIHSMCECDVANCTEGQTLNSDYQCIAVPTTTGRTEPSTTTPATAPVIENPGWNGGKTAGTVVGVVAAISILVVVICCCKRNLNSVVICCCKRNSNSESSEHPETGGASSPVAGNDSSPVSPSNENHEVHPLLTPSDFERSQPVQTPNGVIEPGEEIIPAVIAVPQPNETVISTASHDDTAQLVLNQQNGEIVRAAAERQAQDQRFRERLAENQANRPPNITHNITAENVVLGDHGEIVRQAVAPEGDRPRGRRDNGDNSSPEEDGGREEDQSVSDQSFHTARYVLEQDPNLREDGDREDQTDVKTVHKGLADSRTTDNLLTVDLDQTNVKTVHEGLADSRSTDKLDTVDRDQTHV